jgi:hypothetical protein
MIPDHKTSSRMSGLKRYAPAMASVTNVNGLRAINARKTSYAGQRKFRIHAPDGLPDFLEETLRAARLDRMAYITSRCTEVSSPQKFPHHARTVKICGNSTAAEFG